MMEPSPFGALSTISQFDGNEAVAAAMWSTSGGPSAATCGGDDGASTEGAGDALAATVGSADDSEPLDDGTGLEEEATVLEDAVSAWVDDVVLAHATRLDATTRVSERIDGIEGMSAQSLTRVARGSNADRIS